MPKMVLVVIIFNEEFEDYLEIGSNIARATTPASYRDLFTETKAKDFHVSFCLVPIFSIFIIIVICYYLGLFN